MYDPLMCILVYQESCINSCQGDCKCSGFFWFNQSVIIQYLQEWACITKEQVIDFLMMPESMSFDDAQHVGGGSWFAGQTCTLDEKRVVIPMYIQEDCYNQVTQGNPIIE